MKSVAAVAILAGLAAAYPGELIRKRALEPREGCPRDLTPGQFEFPHYITQISRSEPDKKFGPQLNGVFTANDIASIFSFDVPVERSDANCTLEFIFPAKAQLKTSNFEYQGGGELSPSVSLFSAYFGHRLLLLLRIQSWFLPQRRHYMEQPACARPIS